MKNFILAVLATLTLSMAFIACKKTENVINEKEMHAWKYASLNEDSLADLYSTSGNIHNEFLEHCYESFMDGALDTIELSIGELNSFAANYFLANYDVPSNMFLQAITASEAWDKADLYSSPTPSEKINSLYRWAVESTYDCETPAIYDALLKSKLAAVAADETYTDDEKRQVAMCFGIGAASYQYWTDNYDRWHSIFDFDPTVYPGSPSEKPNQTAEQIKRAVIRAMQADLSFAQKSYSTFGWFGNLWAGASAAYSAQFLVP